MGSCHSIANDSASNSTSGTAITVKEKPAEEETKEEKPKPVNDTTDQPNEDKHANQDTATPSQEQPTVQSVPVTSSETPAIQPSTQSTNSEPAIVAQPAAEPVKPTPEPSKPAAQAEAKPASNDSQSAQSATLNVAESAAFDEEFKSTVKTILLLLLDRLIRTMEYESVMFQELALATGLPNYMELFDYRAFEQFLRDNFAIPSAPSPMQNDADVKHVSQYFSLFLSLAQNGTTTTPTRTFPSRIAFTERLQSLCSSTAAKLLVWCESPHASSEVKEHFLFFSKALEFARGDLINNPKLLYQNIDEITA